MGAPFQIRNFNRSQIKFYTNSKFNNILVYTIINVTLFRFVLSMTCYDRETGQMNSYSFGWLRGGNVLGNVLFI